MCFIAPYGFYIQDSNKQDAYRKLLNNDLNYEKFLNETFVGLKPSHNLLNLITTLASANPDSTIEVKAGVAYTIKNRLHRYP